MGLLILQKRHGNMELSVLLARQEKPRNIAYLAGFFPFYCNTSNKRFYYVILCFWSCSNPIKAEVLKKNGRGKEGNGGNIFYF